MKSTASPVSALPEGCAQIPKALSRPRQEMIILGAGEIDEFMPRVAMNAGFRP